MYDTDTCLQSLLCSSSQNYEVSWLHKGIFQSVIVGPLAVAASACMQRAQCVVLACCQVMQIASLSTRQPFVQTQEVLLQLYM